MIPETKTAQAFALAEWLHGKQHRKNSDEEALKIPYLTHLIDDRTANGVEKFSGEHIHFGTEKYPDWEAVLRYLG